MRKARRSAPSFGVANIYPGATESSGGRPLRSPISPGPEAGSACILEGVTVTYPALPWSNLAAEAAGVSARTRELGEAHGAGIAGGGSGNRFR